jgi:ABC-type lipoprotein release transport system permease subunit
MSIFSTFLKPSIAINMLRANLEKQLNKKVAFFSLVYTASTNTMEFVCDGVRYSFEDNTIKSLIEKTSKSQLKSNQTLDLIVANIDDKNNCDAKLYYSESIKVGNQTIIEKNFVTHKF